MDEELKREFLAEYRALCEKRGLFVHACGCCRSPWLHRVPAAPEVWETSLNDHIEHLSRGGISG